MKFRVGTTGLELATSRTLNECSTSELRPDYLFKLIIFIFYSIYMLYEYYVFYKNGICGSLYCATSWICSRSKKDSYSGTYHAYDRYNYNHNKISEFKLFIILIELILTPYLLAMDHKLSPF